MVFCQDGSDQQNGTDLKAEFEDSAFLQHWKSNFNILNIIRCSKSDASVISAKNLKKYKVQKFVEARNNKSCCGCKSLKLHQLTLVNKRPHSLSRLQSDHCQSGHG